MVKYRLDDVTHAIASAPRRVILDRLAEGEASMSDLAARLGVGLPAVDKHLHVLLDAEMVTKSKAGRTTTVRLVPGSLESLGAWALSTRLMWDNALDRLEQHLASQPETSSQEQP